MDIVERLNVFNLTDDKLSQFGHDTLTEAAAEIDRLCKRLATVDKALVTETFNSGHSAGLERAAEIADKFGSSQGWLVAREIRAELSQPDPSNRGVKR